MVAAPPAEARRPTLRTITIDGDMSDWDIVLANRENVSIDEDASSFRSDCTQTGDLDCPNVLNASKDIARFAWTYDSSGLYFFLERFAASGQTRSWWVAVDQGLDSNMGSGERLLRMQITGPSTHTADLVVFDYVAVSPFGDPMLSPSNLGDGWRLPGRMGTERARYPAPGPPPRAAGNTAATQFEQFVPWADVLQTAGKPVTLHVGLGDDVAEINAVDDNCGGPDRKRLWTLWSELAMSDGQVATAAPGTSVDIPHVATLEGNGNEFINISVVSSQPLPIELWRDADFDGLADPGGRLAVDADGDGAYETVDSDGNGDSLPDDGNIHYLPGQERIGFVVRVLLPAAPATVDADLTTCVQAAYDQTARACVTDRVVSGDLSLTPDNQFSVGAGLQLLFPHELGNQLGSNLVVDLIGNSTRGWSYQYFLDANADGVPDGPALTDRNANTFPDVDVPARSSVNILARTTVPGATPNGTVETFTLTARAASGSPQATATDTATIAPEVELTPSYLRPAMNGYVGPGRAILYRHVLRNNGDKDWNYSVFVISSLGWVSSIFTDPNGDGDPSDGADITATGTVTGVPKYGGSIGLVVQLQAVPPPPLDSVDVATVTAVQQAAPGRQAQATDETIVSQIVTYRDAARLEQSTRFLPCDMIYATAFGLAASLVDGHQFSWFDDTGTLRQSTVFTSDAAGRGYDSFSVPDTAVGQWQVALTRLPTTPLDSQAIVMEGGPVADAITTDLPSYPQAGSDLTVDFTLRNRNVVAPLTNGNVDVVVLDPTRTQYLTAGSTWQPYTGVEYTRTYSMPTLAPTDIFQRNFTVTSVSYPATGDFFVVVRWKFPCASLSSEAESRFAVSGGGGCTGVALPEVTGVRVRKSGSDVVLRWNDLAGAEPCVTYRAWCAARTPVFPLGSPPWWYLDDFATYTRVGDGLATPDFTHSGVVGDRKFNAYIIQPSSPSDADGPLDPYYGM